MYFGYVSLVSYPFVSFGFWVVLIATVGFTLVYPVGSSRGRRAAEQWIRACVVLLVVGGVADVTWAVLSGQWSAFMATFGSGPLVEMAMLGTLVVGSMWFMAVRYTQGLEK